MLSRWQYPLSYPNSHCIYNEQFSRTCLQSSNPKCSQQLGSIMTLCGLLTSIWAPQCEISQFDGIACWKRFSPLSPPLVAMTTSSSLATYLCKGSREFAPELSLQRCDNRYGARNVKILIFRPMLGNTGQSCLILDSTPWIPTETENQRGCIT